MSAEPDTDAPVTVAGRLSTYLRGGGIITPIITVIFAFIVGGLVVLVTGGNPIETYKAIFDGTGLNWFFPWTSEDDRIIAELNLQQTLIIATPLILTGLAVAFAFRCGLFNIGGQGQYLVGTYFAVWVGSSFDVDAGRCCTSCSRWSRRCLAGAAWGAIAGLLKAISGAHEVISTIMLNYDRALDGRVPVRPRRSAAERHRHLGAGLQRHRRGRQAAGLLGRSGAAGPAHRPLHRARGPARLLGAAQPHAHRLRGPRRRLQPRGGALGRASRSARTTCS